MLASHTDVAAAGGCILPTTLPTGALRGRAVQTEKKNISSGAIVVGACRMALVDSRHPSHLKLDCLEHKWPTIPSRSFKCWHLTKPTGCHQINVTKLGHAFRVGPRYRAKSRAREIGPDRLAGAIDQSRLAATKEF